MRVLMIVQEINETHWLRGFITGWVRALAQQVETLHVLTLEYHPTDLPDNVIVASMGKEKGYGRLRILREYYRGLARIVPQVDVIFSHMTPRYAWMATPVALRYQKPQMLWYVHPHIDWELRLATAAATWITTATPVSFPIQSDKIHIMGHGIDTQRFAPKDIQRSDPPVVLAVGRVTPVKRHDLLLEAAGILKDSPIRFAVAGHSAAAGDQAYKAQLIQRREQLGLTEEQFCFLGGLTTENLITKMQQASIVTNLSTTGFFDKAALEGMLTGTPLLTTSPDFSSILGDDESLLMTPDTPAAIAEHIQEILALSPDERQALGARLRKQTAAAHDIHGLMQRMVKVMQSG